MKGIALFARGPLCGTITDSSGAQFEYCIRSAEGTVDSFAADMDVLTCGYFFKTEIIFSRENGTRFVLLLMKPPDGMFEDVTPLSSICSVQYFSDGVVDRGLGYIASDWREIQIQKSSR